MRGKSISERLWIVLGSTVDGMSREERERAARVLRREEPGIVLGVMKYSRCRGHVCARVSCPPLGFAVCADGAGKIFDELAKLADLIDPADAKENGGIE